MSDSDQAKAAPANSIFDVINGINETYISEELTSQFSSEDEFMGVAVSLLAETGAYICVAGSTLGHTPKWSRDHAAVGGNLVRLYKLVSALLDQTVQRRRETSFVFARLAFETIVSIRFMIKNFSPELVKSYVMHSFKHEIKLRKTIFENINKMEGVVSPIEDRMISSIDRSFAMSGIKLEDLEGYREKNWGGKNFFEKCRDLGLEDAYLYVFSGPSHSIHGAWFDIFSHNLEVDENIEFSPNLSWGNPRPQLITGIARLAIPALDEYFEFMAGSEVHSLIIDKITDLDRRIAELDSAHETYLSSKVWPNI